MSRRGVLAAGAGGFPGFLLDSHDSATRAVRSTSQSTSHDTTQGRLQATDGEWSQTATLTADDAAPEARFGYSAAIEGDRALIGADTDNENVVEAGAAYVFEHEDDRWVQTQKLTAEDADSKDRFGRAVALDGNRALVGAMNDDAAVDKGGAVYVFTQDGSNGNGNPDESNGLPLAWVVLGGVVAVISAVAVVFNRGLTRLAAPLLGDGDEEPPAELLSDEERVRPTPSTCTGPMATKPSRIASKSQWRRT